MTQAAGAAPTSALREAQPSNLFLLRLREAVEAVGLLAPVADAQYSSVLEANLAMELRQWLFHTARFPFAQVALDFTVSGTEMAGAFEAILPPAAHRMVPGRVIGAPLPLVRLAAADTYRAERMHRRVSVAPCDLNYAELEVCEGRGEEFVGTVLAVGALGLSADIRVFPPRYGYGW